MFKLLSIIALMATIGESYSSHEGQILGANDSGYPIQIRISDADNPKNFPSNSGTNFTATLEGDLQTIQSGHTIYLNTFTYTGETLIVEAQFSAGRDPRSAYCKINPINYSKTLVFRNEGIISGLKCHERQKTPYVAPRG